MGLFEYYIQRNTEVKTGIDCLINYSAENSAGLLLPGFFREV